MSNEFTVVRKCQCGWESIDWCASKAVAIACIKGKHSCANCKEYNFTTVFLRGRLKSNEAKYEVLRLFSR